MAPPAGKRKKTGWLSLSQFVAVLAGTLAVYAVIAFGGRALDSLHTRERLEGLHAEVAQMEKEQTALQEKLRQVKGPESVERMAREELGMVKPGESPVKVAAVAQPISGEAKAQPTAAGPAATTAGKAGPKAHWQEWWDLLLGPAGATN